MSKELEALDDIQFKLKENCKNNEEYIWLCERTNLIESALKQLENDKQVWENYLKEIKNLPPLAIQMKLKALEIIKNNKYAQIDIQYNSFSDTWQVVAHIEEVWLIVLSGKGKEEYDLLKEVLL